jgi:hypothetical protein
MRLQGSSVLLATVVLGCGSVAHRAEDDTVPGEAPGDAAVSAAVCAAAAPGCRGCPRGAHVWSRVLGGRKEDFGRALAVAENGDVLFGGSFADTLDVCGEEVPSIGWRDGFVLRFDADGRPLWHRALGSTLGVVTVESVAVRRDGASLVTGSEPGFGEADVRTGARSVFVTELSPEGVPRWTRYLSSPASAVGSAVALGPDDAVLVAGSFATVLDLGERTLETRGAHTAFVTKLSRAGTPLWAWALGGETDVVGRDVAVDSKGNVFVLVDAMEVAALVIDEEILPPAELVVVGFDPEGAVRRIVPVTLEGAAFCDCRLNGYRLAVGPDGAVFLTGAYAEPTGADNHSVFFQEAFVQRMAPGGTAFSVVARWPGSARGLAVSGEGEMLVSGNFFGETQMGTHRLTAVGFADAFAARLEASGRVQWATAFGTSASDTSGAAALGPGGAMYVAGILGDHHATTLDVDFGDGPVATFDQTDAFIVKYAW